MIKVIEESVQAIRLAQDSGILGVYHNRIHVKYQLFEKLLNEKGSLEIVKRNCDEYPFEATFTKNGLTYFTLHTEEEIKKIFGGNIDELITSN
ncbi:hypothetical protein COM55_07755 [Bacillus pseudomycoides]|uniref:hypothetical protein n=1 Tax=Bacillus pseudomycoides TaxID=64104 RepID=UPI00030F591A|nr:hypothetical protein [Bacillus pseudomycoides]PGC39798.1 hypothetical protein COM18_16940 [Bacillus pseudomycoides]PGE86644.1 hypothetical protein COM55_07755 [Bacillus pseudomycoides]